ncbi:TetR family transcriptional regulator [Lachnospiraceae bacterium WCA-9-b2]|jgi:AcrR family transcriptional regulator|uniref:TetR family transcriptional regulator n=1 Tax=Sporofaciens musculi TaxID=2681861 RepID=A0A7X3MDK0_9FIRM|nr:TetR/AcrR family transcriptional regulator [Sporofaciens musculi]MCI9422986.1 TetR/AcrR family transcriptional regulator [Dorea sp.]MXP74312.1 TetR family transcriptional regulator [Sporofaciens musculi]
MARNKHPQETVNLILDVASHLFMEKGYEHTSIQEIINNLGGLSKGAIYHHFKSKDDILVAVTERITAESNRLLAAIRNRTDLNGKEKLKAIFKEALKRPVQNQLFTMALDFRNNPKLLSSFLQETVENAAPNYILPIIRQGISDGSIETDYPKELAELIILVANIWTNPMIFNCSAQESYRKFMVFGQMLKGLGLDIVDEEMAERVEELASIYQKNNKVRYHSAL